MYLSIYLSREDGPLGRLAAAAGCLEGGWSCALGRIYESGGAHAFDGSNLGGEGIYGEILPGGVDTLMQAASLGVPLGSGDRFVDLGSGSGRAVLHAFVAGGVSALGVELSAARHAVGAGAVRRLCRLSAQIRCAEGSEEDAASEALHAGGHSLRLLQADMLTADLEGSTLVFLNAVCFSDALLRAAARRLAGLAPGARLNQLF